MMHKNNIHFFVVLVVCTIMTSCGKKKIPTSQKSLDSNKRSIIAAQAKYSDLPVPIGCRLIEEKKSQTQLPAAFLHYVGSISIPSAITFYNQEMERMGWDIVNLSHEGEGMLVCSKPSKWCLVSIRINHHARKNAEKTSLSLFIKQ